MIMTLGALLPVRPWNGNGANSTMGTSIPMTGFTGNHIPVLVGENGIAVTIDADLFRSKDFREVGIFQLLVMAWLAAGAFSVQTTWPEIRVPMTSA
ncbi:MAG: hypothetical protein C0614_09115 [Desulfuromonas sp.]|nr:MAG: hypothetical protein C0614_09115 [Desulfuromonas sp.]